MNAVNDDHAVVEEIRLCDLHASDEDLCSGGGVGVWMNRMRGDGDATSWTQGLDLGSECESPEIINARAEGGVGGSKDGRRTGPDGGNADGVGVRERRSSRCKLVETELREDRWEKCRVKVDSNPSAAVFPLEPQQRTAAKRRMNRRKELKFSMVVMEREESEREWKNEVRNEAEGYL
ncbi:hypothetical protein Lal_00049858 [Lupinus albus]|nr:hypothetical protein Lal_00049858 [Lupinus albus]